MLRDVDHERSSYERGWDGPPTFPVRRNLAKAPSILSGWLLVTTSKAPVTSSDALVSTSFLLLLVRHLLLLAWHLLIPRLGRNRATAPGDPILQVALRPFGLARYAASPGGLPSEGPGRWSRETSSRRFGPSQVFMVPPTSYAGGV